MSAFGDALMLGRIEQERQYKEGYMEAVAQIADLRADNKRLLETWVTLSEENERLREQAQIREMRITELDASNERLRAEVTLWRERFHRAHVSRGEWLKACPLCEPA